MQDKELLELAAKAATHERTNMQDKELLELAAKAAGIEVTAVCSEGVPHRFGGGYWNPLTDDGDALRLAVKLNMYVMRFDTMTTARGSVTSCDERDDGDPYAATRRAIVRAAAEIGLLTPNVKVTGLAPEKG